MYISITDGVRCLSIKSGKQLSRGGVYNTQIGASEPRFAVYVGLEDSNKNPLRPNILYYRSSLSNPKVLRFGEFELTDGLLKIVSDHSPINTNRDVRMQIDRMLKLKGI